VLAENTPVILTSTGYPSVLPTGLSAGTTYYVKNVSGTTFNLSATPGGAAINTSGSQSGTHYILNHAVPVTSMYGASDVPIIQNYLYVSDISRFVFAYGCNDYGSTIQDPMLIRWSDQESVVNWTPSATNQAGSVRLSHGSSIITSIQTRQEIVVWSDSAVYSLQYIGAPVVWSSQLLGDNISIISQNAVAQASGVVYWMGVDKFYRRSVVPGVAQVLRVTLTSAQILALNATPITLIPAPGANKYISIDEIMAKNDFVKTTPAEAYPLGNAKENKDASA
jgi:hypothetical protein